MRKQTVDILLRLDEKEAAYLERLVQKSGRSRSSLLRAMIMGYRLCEKPDPEFYRMMRELSGIGNRVNQLAIKANALGFIDTPMLKQEAKQWQDFRLAISQTYLLPRKELDNGRL